MAICAQGSAKVGVIYEDVLKKDEDKLAKVIVTNLVHEAWRVAGVLVRPNGITKNSKWS